MNLNEYFVNPRNKSKAAKPFVLTKAGDALRHDLDSSSSTDPILLRHTSLPTKYTKKCSTADSSGTKWGSAFISVPNSSSTRKSTSSKITDENQSRTIIALTEGRGHAQCEVGIAIISVSSHHLIICQISDSQNYINTLTKINILNPNEILFPNTFENFGGNRLITKVKEQFPNVRYTSVPRSVFNKASGLDMLTQLCIPSLNGVLLVLQHRYYALAAACALLTYIQEHLYVYYARGSLKIDYQECEGYALIDISTADRLELVCSAKPAQANKFSSLLGILNYCLTKIGTRKLRSWILQPLSKVQYIEERLNCVEELMKYRDTLRSIQALLLKFTNINSLLNLATLIPDNPGKCSIRQLNYIITLNTIIDLVQPLGEVVSDLKQPFFVKLRATLGNTCFTDIKNLIREVVSDSVQPTKGQNIMQHRCFAIKPGVNGLLDAVRKTFTERLNDMKEYIEALAEKYNIPLTLGNNQKKGYHIVLNIPKSQRNMKKSDLPDGFIEINRSSTFFTMKTPELVNISTRLDDIMMDILKISNVIVHSVVIKLKKHIYLFHTLCEEIAQLDVYQSLAQTSLENNYVRPKFGEYTEIKCGQHPLLNFLLPKQPTPNSIFCSDEYNVHIINGPNGSGKSIFIRQVMLLQIMAQLGCYIPAESAIFKPANRMFARIYLEDNMEYNASSFVLEMKEIKYIMSSMTDDCLAIIDELGRSTSVEEGISLAAAILEQLACFSSYIYITTHFTTLSKLNLMYPNIKTWQMETVSIGDDPKTFKLDYRYNLLPGITSIARYGVYIVRNIWPDSIVANIDRCLDNLEKQQRKSLFLSMDPKSLKKYHLESDFKHLKRLGLLTDSKIEQLLVQYQKDLKALNYDLTIQPGYNYQIVPEEKIVDSVEYEQNQMMSTQEILQEEEALKEIFTPISVQKIFTPKNDLLLDESENDFDKSKSCKDLIHNNSNNIFNFREPYYPPQSGFQCSSNNSEHSYNSDFIKILHPIITINEIDNNMLEQQENVINLPNRTYLSSLMSPEEYQSICEEFEDNFEPQPCPDNLNNTIKRTGSLDNIMGERNTYKYYVSPVIVNIKEGLDNTSSFDDDDDGNNNEKFTNNRINIISDVVVKEKEKWSEIVINKSNYCDERIDTDKVIEESEDLEKSVAKNSQCSLRNPIENCTRKINSTIEENLVFTDKDVDNCEDTTKDEIGPLIVENSTKLSSVLLINNSEEAVNNIKDNKTLITNKIVEDCSPKTQFKEVTVLPVEKPKNKKLKPKTSFRKIKKRSTKRRSIESKATKKSCTDQSSGYKTKTEEFLTEDKAVEIFENNKDNDTTNKNNTRNGDFNLIPNNSSSIDISAASKFRNLDGTTSVDISKVHNEIVNSTTYPVDNNSSSNISSASRKRNLDQAAETETSTEVDENKSRKTNLTSHELTGVSSASRKRNLDGSSSNLETTLPSRSSPTKIVPAFRKVVKRKSVRSTKKINLNVSLETSVSNASKNRNFDNCDSNSVNTNKNRSVTLDINSKSGVSNNDSNNCETADTSNGNSKIIVKHSTLRRFVPPRKLSAKQIKQEFAEQDRKLLESEFNLTKYVEHRINRPSVKQIQNATHLATFKKTSRGFEVIPSGERCRNAITRSFSNENVDMSIFSDRNAETFEQFINSKETDFQNFPFNTPRQAGKLAFSFGQTTNENMFNYCIDNNCSQSYGHNDINISLTPNGYYKQNKNTVDAVMNKYLNNSFSNRGTNNLNFNIFGNNHLSNEDLDL